MKAKVDYRLNKYLLTSIYLGTVLRGVKLPRFIERQNRQIDVGLPLMKINMAQR